MCGIAGIFHRRGGRPDPRVLDAMTDRLAHRGPDARGTYLSDGVGFGHRRLAIIGIGDGAQPMSNEDATVWVTFNGEIYNYLALKRELSELGHTFKSHSDTEVIIHGWEAWGARVVDRMRGIFAFGLHDQKSGEVYLARDRLGVKPLYFHLAPEVLLFASEPKAILLHPEMPRRPDLDAIHLYLQYGYVPAPRSAFEGMRQLEPGQAMRVSAADVRIETYWRPGVLGGGGNRRNGARPGDAAEIAAELDRRIDDAVWSELMSEVPLGAFLSGGIDSSIVAASMAHAPGITERPRTFCIGFPQPEFDESSHSRAVAAHLGLDHQVEIVSMSELDLLERLVGVYDEPFADASAIPTYVLSAMARKHVTVALSGDGGDEVFAGYRRYEKLAGWVELPGPARLIAGTAAAIYPANLRGSRRLRLLSRDLAGQYDLDISYFPRAALREIAEPELASREVDWSIAALFERAPGEHPVAKAQWVDLVSYLPGDILVKVDRASMAHALEVRVPLLDHELLEWAFGLPIAETFGADGEGKVALKDHLSRRVPREVFDRPKMGFGVPLGYWLGGEGGLNAIAERLRSRHPARRFRSPIRAEVIETLGGEQLWTVLFLETWWQRHFG